MALPAINMAQISPTFGHIQGTTLPNALSLACSCLFGMIQRSQSIETGEGGTRLSMVDFYQTGMGTPRHRLDGGGTLAGEFAERSKERPVPRGRRPHEGRTCYV